jgi:hypothetical protein
LKFFQQTLIENFQARFDLEFSNAIMIAIENVSRSDQGLIKNCRTINISEDALGASARRIQRILLERIFADAMILSPPLWHPRLR